MYKNTKVFLAMILLGTILLTSGCNTESKGDKTPVPSQNNTEVNQQTDNSNLSPEEAQKLSQLLNHSAKYIDEVANGHLHGDPDLALNARLQVVKEDYKEFKESFNIPELDEAYKTAIYNMEVQYGKDGSLILKENYKENLRKVLSVFKRYAS